MKRKVIETEDGSSTILIEEWGESFHSIHGAIQEAQHVYIDNGLRFVFQEDKQDIDILEIGFGTGLNCFMSFLECLNFEKTIHYVGIEGFPLNETEWKTLNYPSVLSSENKVHFEKIHEVNWAEKQMISTHFNLTKYQLMFDEIDFDNQFDLVYFDAFGYQYQPELWTENIFVKIKKAMKPGGVLVTYACKGVVNRILKELGFTIEKLEGPPGKRHMTRAILNK